MELTRKTFVEAAGAAAVAMAGSAAVAHAEESSSSADLTFAEGAEAPEGSVAELYARQTVHAGYDPDQPVSDEDIDLLLQAAFSAPTGGGQRALDFFPVTDPDVLAKIGQSHKNYLAPQTAPLVIVIAKARARVRFPELVEMDAGLAAEAILVQAARLGLASCCMSIAPQYDRSYNIGAALNLPYASLNDPMYEPILMVALGYPAADTTTGASVNNYEETQVHLNGFTEEKAETVEAAQADADSNTNEAKEEARTAAIDEIAAAMQE